MGNIHYEWITYEDLKSILANTKFFSEEEYISLSPLEQIEKVCLLYRKLFEDAKIEFVKVENKSIFDAYKINSPFQKKAEKCFNLGFNIVYRLRAFLLQEDIIVHEMMVNSKKEAVGVYEESMTNLLKNKQISAKLNQGIVKLEASMTSVGLDNLKKDHLNKWNQVLNYAGMNSLDDFAAEPGDTFEYENRIYQRFRHQKDSRSVVVTGDFDKRKNIKYYYMRDENDFTLFNRGNLFEWFESTMSYYAESTIKSAHKLFNLMMENNARDRIAGYKQGDFYSKKEQSWIQNKYDNHTLMQLKSVDNVISSSKGTKGILQIIQEYKNLIKTNAPEANKQIQQDFLKLFTTSKDNINRTYDDQLGINNYLELEKNNKILVNLKIS